MHDFLEKLMAVRTTFTATRRTSDAHRDAILQFVIPLSSRGYSGAVDPTKEGSFGNYLQCRVASGGDFIGIRDVCLEIIGAFRMVFFNLVGTRFGVQDVEDL